MTTEARAVLEKTKALRDLHRTTGVKSWRTQKKLLIGLTDADLVEVAQALREYEVEQTLANIALHGAVSNA